MKYYTGIGSRETPESLRGTINKISRRLEELGYILRSGAADGADTFFEDGVQNLDNKEIYLPWRLFNGHTSSFTGPTEEAILLAKDLHPAPEKLSESALKLHGRNCHQVLGWDLKTPSDFVICWTPGGKLSGGTAQALRLAHRHNIPVFQLFDKEQCLKDIAEFLKSKQNGN